MLRNVKGTLRNAREYQGTLRVRGLKTFSKLHGKGRKKHHKQDPKTAQILAIKEKNKCSHALCIK